jgi:hypothetical protein
MNDPVIRRSQYLLAPFALLGGLLIAYAVFSTAPKTHGGVHVIFQSGLFWAGVAVVVLTTVAMWTFILIQLRRR